MKIAKIIFKLIKYLLVAIILAIIVLVIIVTTSYKELRAAGESALIGKALLEKAATAVKNSDWDLALKNSDEAGLKINEALTNLSVVKNKPAFSKITILRSQVNDLEYLLKTADIISRSLSRAVPIAQKFNRLSSGQAGYNFSTLAPTEKAEFFKLLYESEPELNGLKANLDLALLNINRIHKIGILWPVYKQISNVKQELSQASNLIAKATPLLKLLPTLAGYPKESDFLIIMQNNDELRPSGGFIGVFGLLKSANGEIISLKTYDSYHLDMPAVGKWKMTPPEPIGKYMKVENWYLRDANWSPDWPTSARKIEEIYYGENKAIGTTTPELAGVIGITPKFVSDLLRLVGDITVRGETYTPENLQSLLQYNVEVAYKEQDIASWDRKQIINELLDELQSRLFALEISKLPGLLDIFENNAKAKDIQIYFNNSNSQALTADLNVDGSVKKSISDYLMIVDANLAAFKSDAVVRKGIEYNLNTNKDAQAIVNLKLSYRHEGGFDWRTTRYRSYTRVYAPIGSKLISIKAQEQANMDEASISAYDDTGLDKTVFGFFFSIEPGTDGTISLQYSLPKNINTDLQTDKYQLFIQKQAGRKTDNFKAIINGDTYNQNLNQDMNILLNK
ncbi:MAG: DUF4012 domain-containing protein [Patescibacteria group bacterium]